MNLHHHTFLNILWIKIYLRIIVRFIRIYITIVLKCIINEFNNHTFLNILWIKIYLESL